MSLSIKVLTAIILAMVVGFLIGGLHNRNLLTVGAVLGTVSLVCYLLAPSSYEIADGSLTVVLRATRICFGQIVGCSRATERLPFTIRLFGNGGLFAGTGIFWNRQYGIFRVYVTSARREHAVLVQTSKYKVLVTPEDPDAFMRAAGTLRPPTGG